MAIAVISTTHAATCESERQEISYYRRLAAVESLLEPIVGIEPISATTAKQVAHYRVSRNSCGEVQRLAYYHGDRLKPVDENFAATAFTPAPVVAFDRNGAQATLTFFDHAEHQTTVLGNVSSIIITSDAQGRPQRGEFRNYTGDLINSSFGYAVCEWRWETPDGIFETRYDVEGNPVLSGGGVKFASALLQLNESGLISKLVILEDRRSVRFNRHDNGALKSWRAYNSDNTPVLLDPSHVFGTDYSYDKNGYVSQLTYVGLDGAPALSAFGHMGFKRKYSEEGNRLAYYFINSAGERWAPDARGYAGQNFFWRKDGLVRIRTEYVDADGKLANHPQRGYAVIAYYFGEDGLIVNRTFFDAAQTPLYRRTP